MIAVPISITTTLVPAMIAATATAALLIALHFALVLLALALLEARPVALASLEHVLALAVASLLLQQRLHRHIAETRLRRLRRPHCGHLGLAALQRLGGTLLLGDEHRPAAGRLFGLLLFEQLLQRERLRFLVGLLFDDVFFVLLLVGIGGGRCFEDRSRDGIRITITVGLSMYTNAYLVYAIWTPDLENVSGCRLPFRTGGCCWPWAPHAVCPDGRASRRDRGSERARAFERDPCCPTAVATSPLAGVLWSVSDARAVTESGALWSATGAASCR